MQAVAAPVPACLTKNQKEQIPLVVVLLSKSTFSPKDHYKILVEDKVVRFKSNVYPFRSVASYRKSIDSKRLKKNKKQRQREWKKKVYITALKKVIINSPLLDVKPKGSRRFTEVCSL